METIEVENLTKVFKARTRGNWVKSLLFPKHRLVVAVKSISFKIRKGEIFGLLGPNGAGKTTTIQMLCGLEYPTKGIIHINGLNIKDGKNFVRVSERLNVMFSDKLLYNRLTAMDNLVFYGNLYGIGDPEEKAENLLELVDLVPWKDNYVAEFSLGMRMKLALARALVNDPEILFLDEPTLGLDIKNAEFVRNFLKKINCTILLTTHYLNEAIMLCDRIGILQKGELVHMGSPEELKKKYVGNRYFSLDTSDNQAVKKILQKNPFVESVFEKNMRLEIYVKQCEDFFEILNDIKEFKLYQFQELKTGLEGLFYDVEDEPEKVN